MEMCDGGNFLPAKWKNVTSSLQIRKGRVELKKNNACQISKASVWCEFYKRTESVGARMINERSPSGLTEEKDVNGIMFTQLEYCGGLGKCPIRADTRSIQFSPDSNVYGISYMIQERQKASM